MMSAVLSLIYAFPTEFSNLHSSCHLFRLGKEREKCSLPSMHFSSLAVRGGNRISAAHHSRCCTAHEMSEIQRRFWWPRQDSRFELGTACSTLWCWSSLVSSMDTSQDCGSIPANTLHHIVLAFVCQFRGCSNMSLFQRFFFFSADQ